MNKLQLMTSISDMYSKLEEMDYLDQNNVNAQHLVNKIGQFYFALMNCAEVIDDGDNGYCVNWLDFEIETRTFLQGEVIADINAFDIVYHLDMDAEDIIIMADNRGEDIGRGRRIIDNDGTLILNFNNELYNICEHAVCLDCKIIKFENGTIVIEKNGEYPIVNQLLDEIIIHECEHQALEEEDAVGVITIKSSDIPREKGRKYFRWKNNDGYYLRFIDA